LSEPQRKQFKLRETIGELHRALPARTPAREWSPKPEY
jgi:hypothetical protein